MNPSPESWREKLALVVDTMREISSQTNPQDVVQTYGRRLGQFSKVDRRLSLSRRDLNSPKFRITRSTTWNEVVDPWKEKERLPLLEGGLLAELIYSNEPRLISQFEPDPQDPAYAYLEGQKSLLAIPMFDKGESLNMVVLMQQAANAFVEEQIADLVWRSNLFGRATSNLVISEELKKAYDDLDREFRLVGDIQRSLLPEKLPKIPSMDLAAYYQPSRRAGGDYYDFFPFPNGQWGILIADVSGHGTPAAVLMAVTHSLAHSQPMPNSPGKMLESINRLLRRRYTISSEMFVTAFYAVYDPETKTLTYARAGHNPPRLKRCQSGSLAILDQVNGLPLGILDRQSYAEAQLPMQSGDQIVFYTDGVTEAQNAQGEMFSTKRLDHLLENCTIQAAGLLNSILEAVNDFTANAPPEDDRTLIVARLI